jgi:hypothetical protein
MDIGIKPDRTAVSVGIIRCNAFEVIETYEPPVIYFSSAWTGIVSREEREYKDLKLMVQRYYSETVEKKIEESIWGILTKGFHNG